jgi:hypothetical protein
MTGESDPFQRRSAFERAKEIGAIGYEGWIDADAAAAAHLRWERR